MSLMVWRLSLKMNYNERLFKTDIFNPTKLKLINEANRDPNTKHQRRV
jgi:hypothetical protein